MPIPIKRYDHGGTHENPEMLRALDVIYHTGEKGKKKYDTNTLLDMLRFSDVKPEVKPGDPAYSFIMDPSLKEQFPEEYAATGLGDPAQFRAFKTKDGQIRVTSFDKESGLYNPATGVRKMTADQLSELAGRQLSSTETREFRSLLMSDPSFLNYFINIEEKTPKKGEFRKVKIAKNVGKRSGNIGAGTTGGKGSGSGCVSDGKGGLKGTGCILIKRGLSDSWGDR
jgi:hypothetical protein